MGSFGRSAANVTIAIRPYGARSRRAGTWEYLEAQADSSNEPQSANACCIRTGRTALLLNIWPTSVGDSRSGGKTRATSPFLLTPLARLCTTFPISGAPGVIDESIQSATRSAGLPGVLRLTAGLAIVALAV